VRVRKKGIESDIQGKEKFQSLMAPTSASSPAPSNVKRGPHSAPCWLGSSMARRGNIDIQHWRSTLWTRGC
jgi:hypothetical protein